MDTTEEIKHHSRCLIKIQRGPCFKTKGHTGDCWTTSNRCFCCGAPRAQITPAGPVCIDCPYCKK